MLYSKQCYSLLVHQHKEHFLRSNPSLSYSNKNTVFPRKTNPLLFNMHGCRPATWSYHYMQPVVCLKAPHALGAVSNLPHSPTSEMWLLAFCYDPDSLRTRLTCVCHILQNNNCHSRTLRSIACTFTFLIQSFLSRSREEHVWGIIYFQMEVMFVVGCKINIMPLNVLWHRWD